MIERANSAFVIIFPLLRLRFVRGVDSSGSGVLEEFLKNLVSFVSIFMELLKIH